MAKHVLVCAVCGKEFEAGRSHAKYCSQRCSSKGEIVASTATIAPTSTVGAIGELRACAYFLERGYFVFRSVTPNAPCDLIAIKGNRMFRIEVKTSRELCSGRLSYSLNKRNVPWVDYVAAVHPDGSVHLHAPDRTPVDVIDLDNEEGNE